MKKIVLIILGLLFLIGCISSIDHIKGGVKVENRLRVYIDNLSSKDIIPTISFGESSTCGGITLQKHTTGSFIEVDFTKDTKAQYREGYSVSLIVTTSDTAIEDRYKDIYYIASYNVYSDGIYMNYPRPKMIIKDSQSTESAFEIKRESY